LKKAALEQFLASKAAHDAMKISIIAETVNSYAQLIADSATLEIAKLNLELQNEKYDLVNAKYEVGSASKADQITALSDRENSKINYENYRKLVESDKHDLMVLCGSFDEKNLPQITSLHEIKINESALSFVASKALLSRPDIQEAEHSLKSANANIGAARAAFFPSITLTGNDGYASTGNMQSLIAPSQKSWTFTPQINLPIFSGGRNFATLKLSKAQKEAAIAEYQKAIQTAFREALDELENRKSIVEQLQSAEEILKARKDFFKISKARNEVGITSKSDLIDDRILFLAAKQNELGTRKEYIANLVNLYKVLGGGSELERED
jgi:multidrug efflux system outer membrane protein